MKKICACFILFMAAAFLSAEGASIFGLSVQGKIGTFRLSQGLDSVLLGAGVAFSGGDLILDNGLKLNRQDYDPSKVYDKNDVNSFDRFFMHSYDERLDSLADYGVAAAMAAPLVLGFTDKDEWITEGVMYTETLLIANGLKELIKLGVNRARPYMYYDASTLPESDLEDGDWANSFLSGHTTMSFAGAAFATYTFGKYFPDSAWKYAVAAGSFSLAAGTSVLRLESGNHFMTDIICGGILGTAVGFAVPWLHTLSSSSGNGNGGKAENVVSLLPNGFYVKVSL